MTHSEDSEALRTDPLVREAASLPRQIEPPRDLWPQIAAALDEREVTPVPAATQRRWRWLAAACAAGLALMALSSGATWWMLEGRHAAGTTELVAALESNRSTFGATLLGPEFMQARNALLADLEVNLQQLAPHTRRAITRNLVEIHQSVEAINAALNSDPSNGSLQQLLFSTYQQELALLTEINRLAGGRPTEMS